MRLSWSVNLAGEKASDVRENATVDRESASSAKFKNKNKNNASSPNSVLINQIIARSGTRNDNEKLDDNDNDIQMSDGSPPPPCHKLAPYNALRSR